MASIFSRTSRALTAEPSRTWLLFSIATALMLLLWLLWAFAARIDVYEVSREARLEVSSATHVVEAPVEGRVSATHLTLGKIVNKGDLLVELDGSEAALLLEQEQVHLGALEGRLDALLAQIEARANSLTLETENASAELSSARARLSQARASRKMAAEVAQRLENLPANFTMELEVLRARSEVVKEQGAERAARYDVGRMAKDIHVVEGHGEVELRELGRLQADLEGQLGEAEVRVKAFEQVLEKHSIRAPVSGTIGSLASLKPGEVVSVGELLCAVVPDGRLRVVAEFEPGSALGRLEVGQEAWLRLNAFPWTQYGMVHAQISQLAQEPSDGSMRAELDILGPTPKRLTLRHGLPGQVDVQVEQVSPAALLLRTLGRVGEQFEQGDEGGQ